MEGDLSQPIEGGKGTKGGGSVFLNFLGFRIRKERDMGRIPNDLNLYIKHAAINL